MRDQARTGVKLMFLLPALLIFKGGSCISQGLSHHDKITDINNLKGKIVILAHGFRGLSPELLGTMGLGRPSKWQDCVEEGLFTSLWTGSKKERQIGPGAGYSPQGHAPLIQFSSEAYLLRFYPKHYTPYSLNVKSSGKPWLRLENVPLFLPSLPSQDH
jgi:hypothetical protein